MSKVQAAARAVVGVVPQVLLRLGWVPNLRVGGVGGEGVVDR